MSKFHYEDITIIADPGNKLTAKQVSAIKSVLLAVTNGTIGEKYNPVKTEETETGVVYRVGGNGSGSRTYLVELDSGAIHGKVSGAGMNDRYFSCWVEKVPESDEESDEIESEVESNVELDSDGYVTWECFDTFPYLVKQGGISVNLTYRPAFFPDEGMYRAVADGDEDSFMVEWTGTAERCEWDNPSRIVTLDEYNAENVGNAKDHVPAEVLDVYEQEADSVEKPAAYVPSMESALAEMIQCSAIPAALDGSVLATVQREDGRVKSGALLKTRGRGLVFMEWETGFVYRIPAKGCKRSKGQGFTVLTLSDTALRKERNLQNIFTARSLF